MSEELKKFNTVNKILSKKSFHYDGPFFPFTNDIKIRFNYNIKIVGIKQFITVGEWKDYLSFDVEILNVEPKTTGRILLKEKEFIDSYVNRILQNEIRSLLSFLGLEQYYVHINEIKIMDNLKPITESSSEKRGVVREVVKDIITLVKKGEGEYTLPEDLSGEVEYDFPNLQTTFSVEVRVTESENVEGFDIDGGYYSDDDTFEIDIIYNPKFLPDLYYDLIGELNEVFRHELQHLIQNEKGIPRPTENLPPEEYYTQPHEIDAQIQGFRRASKLRKIPFEKVVRQWYYSKNNLTDEQKERIINKILKTNRELFKSF